MHLSTVIADVLGCSSAVESVTILSDVVYGACCIDDVSASLIGCDLLVHYGHSCLFEIPKSLVSVIYVFVEVCISTSSCVSLALEHIDCSSLAVLGTIQYAGAVRKIRQDITSARKLLAHSGTQYGPLDSPGVSVPRVWPLSPGEVLGCTSPSTSADSVLFVAEGRFHLESVMIQNPKRKYFRYCPSSGLLVREFHDHEQFLEMRESKKQAARKASEYLVVFGTLGRQGCPLLLSRIEHTLGQRGAAYTVAYASEIDEDLLGSLAPGTAVVEIACPRLALDWGGTFDCPILTPSELFALDTVCTKYEMDYYKKDPPKHLGAANKGSAGASPK